MPFCSQCGTRVADADTFCSRCGARQPVTPSNAARPTPPPRPGDPLSSFDPRTASVLCYVPGLGWIMALVVLASTRFRNDLTVRFHAFQGLYLFVAWLIAQWVLHPATFFLHFGADRIVELVLLGMSIFMMLKAGQNEAFALPIFGELAHRSATGN